MAINPFKISVSDADIEIVKLKLSLATYPDEVDFSDDWAYGAPLSDVKRLAKYWQHDFDWREQEKKLNQLPHFTTDISVDNFGDLNIHFLHQKSGKPDSIPLLFCHGCKSSSVYAFVSLVNQTLINIIGPGSFLEVVKILPLLTQSSDGPHFDVVAPSLPNFGFSDAVKKPGFGLDQYAQTIHKLMIKLGYDKYGETRVILAPKVYSLTVICSHPGRRLGLLHHTLRGAPIS